MQIISYDIKKGKTVKNKLPEELNSEYYKSAELKLEAAIKSEEGIFKFCKEDGKIFLDSDFQFMLSFRRFVAITLHSYLEKFTNLELPETGRSSKQQREVIGLFYHLLSLLGNESNFLTFEENIVDVAVITPHDTIHDDLKGYGKYSV